MNKVTLFTLLVACSLVLADTASDCAALTTQTNCDANTSCKYTAGTPSCTNKCNALSTTDCALAANTSNCDVVSSCAQGYSNCGTLNAKADCEAQTACSYTDTVNYACDNKASIQTACAGKDQSGCTSDNKCTYTPGAFTCSYKAGGCSSKAEADCDTNYCTKTDFVCKAVATSACSDILTEQDCSADDAASKGCSWDSTDSVCTDTCAGKNSTDCAAESNCQTETPYSCADKQSGDSCSAQNTSEKCTLVSSFCTGSTDGTCAANATYCSSQQQNACAADTNCDYTAPVSASCSNKATAEQCSTLTAQVDCTGNAGCSWKATSCANKQTTSCLSTDTQTVCTGSGKFCSYSDNGTCGVSDTFSSILAVGLVYIIALI